MIPKIIVWEGDKREELLEKIGIKVQESLQIESEGLGVEDFRHFLSQSIDVLQSRPTYRLVIWSADRLSWESQAVLLKPLEEIKEELILYLIVGSESLLAETIISRCLVERCQTSKESTDDHWEKLLLCWRGDPADCLSLAEGMEKKTAEEFVATILQKMNTVMEKEVSDKRIELLEESLLLASDLRIKNINVKMAVADYLLRTQKLVKP